MRIFINPKAEWQAGYTQWAVLGKGWRICGWIWPWGLGAKLGSIDFTWYSKRFLKGRGATVEFLGYKIHWYGAFTTKGWK